MLESKIFAGTQVVALFLGGAAMLLGMGAVYSVVYPGLGGECGRHDILFAYIVNVPIGLVGLGIGLFIKRGDTQLRCPCVAVSLVVLSLPVLANLVSWFHDRFNW